MQIVKKFYLILTYPLFINALSIAFSPIQQISNKANKAMPHIIISKANINIHLRPNDARL